MSPALFGQCLPGSEARRIGVLDVSQRASGTGPRHYLLRVSVRAPAVTGRGRFFSGRCADRVCSASPLAAAGLKVRVVLAAKISQDMPPAAGQESDRDTAAADIRGNGLLRRHW